MMRLNQQNVPAFSGLSQRSTPRQLVNISFASSSGKDIAQKQAPPAEGRDDCRFDKKGCVQKQKIKRWGVSGSIWLSLVSLFGGLGYFSHQNHQQYRNQPAFQTYFEVKRSLQDDQDTIPALADQYHTSMVFKNQLMAHLNSVALYNPQALENQPLSRAQKSLIHDLDHIRYTEEDQRAIGKIAAKLEFVALEIDQNKRPLDDLNTALSESYQSYAETVLSKHLKPHKIALYQTLSNQYRESQRGRDMELLKVLGFLFANIALTGVLLQLRKRLD